MVSGTERPPSFLISLEQLLDRITNEANDEIAELDANIDQQKKNIADLNHFQDHLLEHYEERDAWKTKRDEQRHKHALQIEEIENEKVQEIEKLRKEMLLQIRAVKVNMLNLNEEQLVGTTKLTVIQNAQLTGELEYQSKQTEHLMYKNH